MEHIVIVGNGIAGVTAARHIRKQSDKRITLISAEARHFFSRTALMYVYMGHMQWKDIEPYEAWFWEKNRLDLVKGYIRKVDPKNKTLELSDGGKIPYDQLILATGSVTNTFGWKGLDLPQVLGLVSKQDLEQLEKVAPNKEKCPRAVIIGGGLIGVELAEMLRTRDIEVIFLIREKAFWNNVLPLGDAGMISRHIASHGVELRFETELDSILSDSRGNVRAVRTNKGEDIPCSMVGITTGVRPNIGFLKGSGIETNKGILVNRQLETNIPGIYAIGDCAEQRQPIGHRPAVEAVWYTGRMMGEAVARTICGTPTAYRPSNWFNSAKFFDIEYQTYGWVFPESRRKEGEGHLHWLHPDDDKCITIAFEKGSGRFLGINTFGIRMKHEVFEGWLNKGKSVDFVVNNLYKANFDPEFYRTGFKAIINSFQQQLNQPVS